MIGALAFAATERMTAADIETYPGEAWNFLTDFFLVDQVIPNWDSEIVLLPAQEEV